MSQKALHVFLTYACMSLSSSKIFMVYVIIEDHYGVMTSECLSRPRRNPLFRIFLTRVGKAAITPQGRKGV